MRTQRRFKMRRLSLLRPTTMVIMALALGVANGRAAAQEAFSPNVSVFASGLNNPRGLTFGPDGSLYVAEGGVGGTNPTAPECDQLGYTGSNVGARILKVAHNGELMTVADNLPSSQTSADEGSL